MDPLAILANPSQTSGNPGGPAPAANPNNPADPAAPGSVNTPPAFEPAYASQLPKPLQSPEIYAKLAVTGGPKIEHLADAFLKTSEELTQFKSKAYVPGKDAKPEEIQAFRKAYGVPDTHEGYKLDRSGDLAALPSLPGLDEFTAKLYHKHGLPAEVGEALFKENAAKTLEIIKGIQAENQARTTACIKELETRWGRDFAQKKIDTEKAFESYLGAEAFKEFQASPLANNPDFLDKLSGLRKYMSEATTRTNGGHTGTNPWADATFNLTEQGKIMRENPTLAVSLAQAAGKTLKL